MRKMFKSLTLALVLLLALTGAAWAVYNGARTVAGTGTAFVDAVIPGDANSRTAVVALSATSNHANGVLGVFFPTYKTTIDATSSSTTLNVAATTGFSVGSSLVVQTASGGVAERYVTAVSAGESLTIDSALPSGYGAVGGTVWLVGATADANIPVGNATVSHGNEQGVIVGPKNSPIVLSLKGASVTSAAINYATFGFK